VADTFIAHLFLRFEFGQHSVRCTRLHLRLICAVQAATPHGYRNEWSLWKAGSFDQFANLHCFLGWKKAAGRV
jgi:hypothetical protein